MSGVINNLKQCGLPHAHIAAIVGHSNNDVTLDRYGKKYKPSVLVDTVNAIDYPSLDLAHLSFDDFLRRSTAATSNSMVCMERSALVVSAVMFRLRVDFCREENLRRHPEIFRSELSYAAIQVVLTL